MSSSPITIPPHTDFFFEIKETLARHSHALSDRCTGAGKTYSSAELAADYLTHGYPVLYISPGSASQTQFLSSLSLWTHQSAAELLANPTQLRCLSYQKLVRLWKKNPDEIMNEIISCFKLFLFDEAHQMGARETSKVCRKLTDYLKARHLPYLGLTGTLERLDGFDVAGEFFDHYTVGNLSLQEAFATKLLIDPYYVYTTYGYEVNLMEMTLDQLAGGRFSIAKMNAFEQMRTDMTNLHDILFRHITAVYGESLEPFPDRNLRIIIFLGSLELIVQKRTFYADQVYLALSPLIPDLRIRTILVSSRPLSLAGYPRSSHVQETDEIIWVSNLDEIQQVTPPHTVDLYFTVNILATAAHFHPHIGIVSRQTYSNALFIQILGRLLQRNSSIRSIIFDLVSNLSLHPVSFVSSSEKHLYPDSASASRLLSSIRLIEAEDHTAEVEIYLRRLAQHSFSDTLSDVIISAIQNDEIKPYLSPALLCDLYHLTQDQLELLLYGQGLRMTDVFTYQEEATI